MALSRFAIPDFSRAVGEAALAAAAEFAEGIDAYRRHQYRRPAEAASIVWSAGAATLLDHGIAGRKTSARRARAHPVPALFVPSLINRGWILDLIPGQGMLSALAQSGVRPFRIEWGTPGASERDFDIGRYVTERLQPALEAVVEKTGQRPVLVGYCMGGLLALAAALRRPELVRGLVLLATPWDFHAPTPRRAELLGTLYTLCRPALVSLGEMPVDLLQALFALQDPIVAFRKYRTFGTLDPASDAARRFVALEDWLNDGVPLTLPVADDALLGWYGENRPATGRWQVAGQFVEPASCRVPTLCIVPAADRIVPPASADALVRALPAAERLDVGLGHIGMVAAGGAMQALWAPLGAWIRACPPA